MCYLGLLCVALGQASSGSQVEDSPDLSILAIAGAMFLLLSTAAADLQVGLGLMFYTDTKKPWMRTMFGFVMCVNFVLLVWSSVHVLFSSSFGNVDIVIGAVAVLFIADVVSQPELLFRREPVGTTGLYSVVIYDQCCFYEQCVRSITTTTSHTRILHVY